MSLQFAYHKSALLESRNFHSYDQDVAAAVFANPGNLKSHKSTKDFLSSFSLGLTLSRANPFLLKRIIMNVTTSKETSICQFYTQSELKKMMLATRTTEQILEIEAVTHEIRVFAPCMTLISQEECNQGTS